MDINKMWRGDEELHIRGRTSKGQFISSNVPDWLRVVVLKVEEKYELSY